MLYLKREHWGVIVGHVARAGREECCGLLVGRREGADTHVLQVHPADNVWEGDRTCRYMIDPRTHLRVQKESRLTGLEIVGFYHSHPNGSPTPSAFDLELAWPDHAFLIVATGETRTELKAWRLAEDGSRLLEEEWKLEDD
jgi:desampylase